MGLVSKTQFTSTFSFFLSSDCFFWYLTKLSGKGILNSAHQQENSDAQ